MAEFKNMGIITPFFSSALSAFPNVVSPVISRQRASTAEIDSFMLFR